MTNRNVTSAPDSTVRPHRVAKGMAGLAVVAAGGGGLLGAVTAASAATTGGPNGAAAAAVSYVDSHYPGSGQAQVLNTPTPDVDRGRPVYDLRVKASNGVIYALHVVRGTTPPDSTVYGSPAENQGGATPSTGTTPGGSSQSTKEVEFEQWYNASAANRAYYAAMTGQSPDTSPDTNSTDVSKPDTSPDRSSSQTKEIEFEQWYNASAANRAYYHYEKG